MKRVAVVVALLLSMFTTVIAAEYHGRDLDGERFSASAYSYGTHHYYNVEVEFSGTEVTIYFRNGHITVDMDDEEIDDPHSISAYDYKNHIYWDIDVEDLD